MDHDALLRTVLDLIEEQQAVSSSGATPVQGKITTTRFAQIVAKGVPALLHDAQPSLPAYSWTKESLRESLGDALVDIAATPHGRADSIVEDTYFAEPATITLKLADFLQRLQDRSDRGWITYLQSQDDNLSKAPFTGIADQACEPAFAEAYFGRPAEASNIWIGDERSTTSLHQDTSYHNLYTVVRGVKTFTLFAPTERICLYERRHRHAHYVLTSGGLLRLCPSVPSQEVPWPAVDPFAPLEQVCKAYPLFRYARPMTVHVRPGETLYIPPSWFHAVQQQCEGQTTSLEWQPCIALNWWYERDFSAPDWPAECFLRTISDVLQDHRKNVTGAAS